MLSNNRISFVKTLHQKKKRRERGVFLAEGDKLVREFLLSGFHVEELYAETDWLRKNSELLQGVETYGASSSDLERITTLVTAPPVIAVVKEPEIKIERDDFLNGLTLVLDGIRDPGNLGTIIRTADWFGIDRIVASEDCADHWNPKVVQASMGSLTRVRIITEDPVAFITEMQRFAREKKREVPAVYGTFMDGENVYQTSLTQSGFIVIGNEANGIRDTTAAVVTHRIGIPSYNKTESLNAAIATALIVAEFRRRNG